MSYSLEITPEAEEDLARIAQSLPASRRKAAIRAVVDELAKLAVNPSLAVQAKLSRPTYRFHFTLDKVTYHWAATFAYSTDERAIVVTQIYRLAL